MVVGLGIIVAAITWHFSRPPADLAAAFAMWSARSEWLFRKVKPVVMLAACIYLVAPQLFKFAAFNLEPALRVVGLVVMTLSLVVIGEAARQLNLSRRNTFGSQQLITTWYYGRIRHPIYGSCIVLTLGVGLTFANLAPMIMVGTLVAIKVCSIPAEERYLARRFGDEFAAYKARTGRFLPSRPSR
jgi:protein-S-isoprenylcysteine O-methyltransferase Ste14